jgi:hypothetical protein
VKYLKIFNKENIFVLVLTFYIFFWDMFLTLGIKFDIRLIILILSFFLIKEIIIDLKKNNYTFFYLTFIIFLSLTSHSFLVGNILNMKFFLSIFFLLYIFGIVYYFGHTILINKNKIIYLFIYLFLISIFFHYMIGFDANPEPFSCGGLKNFFGEKNTFDKPIFLIHFISSYSLIFNENSHLAMSGVAAIIYSLYLISSQKQKKISIFVLILFIIIVFLKSSATLLMGIIFSITAIIISEYKRLNKYSIFSFISLLIILFIVFATDKVCVNKVAMDANNKNQFENFNPLSKKNIIEDMMIEINQFINAKEVDLKLKKKIEKKINKLISDQSLSNEIKLEIIEIKKLLLSSNYTNKKIDFEKTIDFEKIIDFEKKINKSKDKIFKTRKNELDKQHGPYLGSLSSDVFFHALKVTYDSVFIKPSGWGFQGYELAYNNYNKTHNIFKKYLKEYNNKDASNNTFKIITEFGIFSMIIFLFLLHASLNKKISLENKIFLLPFLVTQLIRGAGYFNGAFILMFFLLIMLQFKNIDKDSK